MDLTKHRQYLFESFFYLTQVYRKLLFASMIADFLFYLLHNVLIPLNIFIRLQNKESVSTWMRFEIHPVTVFCQSVLETGILMLQLVWFLKFGWKNETIVAKEKLFGIKLKILSHFNFLFIMMVRVYETTYCILPFTW